MDTIIVIIAGRELTTTHDQIRALDSCGHAVATPDGLRWSWGSTPGWNPEAPVNVLTEALASGDAGAFERALVLRCQRRHERTIAAAAVDAADRQLHAARVQRQAAVLVCRAARVSEDYTG